MSQPGMRVTVDAAMRARDVSRPWDDDRPPLGSASPEPVGPEAAASKPAATPGVEGEGRGRSGRRRLGRRHARG
ncbi:MAG TPA: hypothetical protein VF069_17305 [Streptosporangiaceae bacterium]